MQNTEKWEVKHLQFGSAKSLPRGKKIKIKIKIYIWFYQNRISDFSSADTIMCLCVSETGVLHLNPKFLKGFTTAACTLPNLQEKKKKWRNNTCMSDIIHPRVYTTLDTQAPLELVNNWWRSSSANSSGLIRGRMRLFDLEVWPHHCMIKYTLPGLMRRSLLSVLSRTECH